MTHIVLIDNYDSFTYNLADGLRRHADVTVHRNDAMAHDAIEALDPDGIVLSPGPGHPANDRDFGVCKDLILDPLPVPMLGVCLGMQGMVHWTGGSVGAAPSLVHGEADSVDLRGHALFAGLSMPLEVGRYHSLCVTDLPATWRPLGTTADGTLMAAHHIDQPWIGVQFHPESILTPQGQTMLDHFVEMCR